MPMFFLPARKAAGGRSMIRSPAEGLFTRRFFLLRTGSRQKPPAMQPKAFLQYFQVFTGREISLIAFLNWNVNRTAVNVTAITSATGSAI